MAAIKQAKAKSEALVARRRRIVQLLKKEGLQDYLPLRYRAGNGWDGGWDGRWSRPWIGAFRCEVHAACGESGCSSGCQLRGPGAGVLVASAFRSRLMTRWISRAPQPGNFQGARSLLARLFTSPPSAEDYESPVPGLTSYVDSGKGSERAGKGAGVGAAHTS